VKKKAQPEAQAGPLKKSVNALARGFDLELNAAIDGARPRRVLPD
jgi:hypothetical protein